MKTSITLLLFVLCSTVFAQSRFSKQEFTINGYRNPSTGLEYRYKLISVHAGYYPSNFKANVTTSFFKAGVNAWFLPVGKKENPSSFYAGVDYLRGFDFTYEKANAVGIETGFRWMIWKGLSLRLGAIAVAAKGHDVRFNPTSGISYSFFIR